MFYLYTRGIPWACLILIYQQPMARIAAAFEACGLVHCAVYTSQGEAVTLCLSLPLVHVYSRIKLNKSEQRLPQLNLALLHTFFNNCVCVA